MVQVIVVNGAPRAGKTTFEDICIKKLGIYGTKISTIDVIKDIALECGWNGEKTEKSRKFLSDLKKLVADNYDLPFKTIREYVRILNSELERFNMENNATIYCFVDSREPDEIERIIKEFNGIAIYVDRGDGNKEYGNSSDSNTLNVKYDYIIENSGTIENLEETAEEFLALIKGAI